MIGFLKIIDELQSDILSLLESPNFFLLERAHTVLSQDFSQVASLNDFGRFLNELTILIDKIAMLLFRQVPIANHLPFINSALNKMKFMLRSDRISYSNELRRLWPTLTDIPKPSFIPQLKAIKERFVVFETLPILNQLGDEIKKLKDFAMQMEARMKQYEEQMNNSDPTKFLSVNISFFSVKGCIWRSVERVLTMFLEGIKEPPLASKQNLLTVENRIQENMKTLKNAITKYINNAHTQSQRYKFDQIVQIMEGVADLIEIQKNMFEYHEGSKVNLSSKLQNAVKKLSKMLKDEQLPF